jgi:hypothetical protein
MSTAVTGPHGNLYADPRNEPDETSFQVNNTSAAYYNSPYYLAHQKQVQPIPPRRSNQPVDLRDYLPASMIQAIVATGTLQFHAVGDTGAAKVGRSQSAPTALEHQGHVADLMAADIDGVDPAKAPAFFFHLGDVVYNFGEAQYYYDQFYEPYRAYDRPIFAIPGNHDAMVYGSSSAAPALPSLQAFVANFCAAAPAQSPSGGGLMRSVVCQPGVFFTLDAPFVSIIGLYSNALDSGPGVISSEAKRYPISDEQLAFLQQELARLKNDRAAHARAIVLATHHPALSCDARHGGSTGMSNDIDRCCKAAGLWPDLVLSGHAHLYQRFTRKMPDGSQIPYVVAGCGGYAATQAMHALPTRFPATIGDATLEIKPIVDFGYLTVSVDANKKQLAVMFNEVGTKGNRRITDQVTVDLVKRALIANKP